MLPRTESYKTIAMHCRQKTICISASFPPFFMILIVFNSQEAHLSNGIRTRKNGYVLAEIWSAQAESKKHCNSFVRHCISTNGNNDRSDPPLFRAEGTGGGCMTLERGVGRVLAWMRASELEDG